MLTPGEVATTQYGNKKRSNPTVWKIFLKREMTCKASISWRTSSPTCSYEKICLEFLSIPVILIFQIYNIL